MTWNLGPTGFETRIADGRGKANGASPAASPFGGTASATSSLLRDSNLAPDAFFGGPQDHFPRTKQEASHHRTQAQGEPEADGDLADLGESVLGPAAAARTATVLPGPTSPTRTPRADSAAQ